MRATAVVLKNATLRCVSPYFSGLRSVAPFFQRYVTESGQLGHAGQLGRAEQLDHIQRTEMLGLKSANLRRVSPFFSALKRSIFFNRVVFSKRWCVNTRGHT